MHGTKTGNAAVAGQPPSAATLPVNYPEWISRETFEIGLPHSEEASQTVFPFARVLDHRRTR